MKHTTHYYTPFFNRMIEFLFNLFVGSYCEMPDDWMKKKLAEAAVRPSNDDLFKSMMIYSIRILNRDAPQTNNERSISYNLWIDIIF